LVAAIATTTTTTTIITATYVASSITAHNDDAIVGFAIQLLSVEQVEPLFRRLIAICRAGDTSWKAAEGALQGVTSIIRRFHWTSKADGDGLSGDQGTRGASAGAVDSLGERDSFCLAFNGARLPEGLPLFVTEDVRGVAYALLSHRQLSIRENATKVFSAYLSRSPFREALAALHEIVSRLRRHVGDEREAEAAADGNVPPADTSVGWGSVPPRLLDPYEAEGLLGVCTFIVKHIPPGFLLPRWPLYFGTFDLYLM